MCLCLETSLRSPSCRAFILPLQTTVYISRSLCKTKPILLTLVVEWKFCSGSKTWGDAAGGAVCDGALKRSLLQDLTQIRCTTAPDCQRSSKPSNPVTALFCCIFLTPAGIWVAQSTHRFHLLSRLWGAPACPPGVSPGPAALPRTCLMLLSLSQGVSELTEAAIALSKIFHASSQVFFGAGFK